MAVYPPFYLLSSGFIFPQSGQALGASMRFDPAGPVPLQLTLLKGKVAPSSDGLAAQTGKVERSANI
jgi:hypothetical protein